MNLNYKSYILGDHYIINVPILIAYYDNLGIPKNKDGYDVTTLFKYKWIHKNNYDEFCKYKN